MINQAPTTIWRDNIFPNSNCQEIFNTNQRNNTSTSNNSRGMQVQSSRRSQSSKPRYPQYTSKSYRLDSYSNWPRNLQQRPEDLAAAGFFHIGVYAYCHHLELPTKIQAMVRILSNSIYYKYTYVIVLIDL